MKRLLANILIVLGGVILGLGLIEYTRPEQVCPVVKCPECPLTVSCPECQECPSCKCDPPAEAPKCPEPGTPGVDDKTQYRKYKETDSCAFKIIPVGLIRHITCRKV